LPVVAGVRLFVRIRICRVAAFLSLENVTRCGMNVNNFLPRCGRKLQKLMQKNDLGFVD
jgi:hypothetical protein